MKIVFQGGEYQVSRGALLGLRAQVEKILNEQYSKIDSGVRLALKFPARHYLKQLEAELGEGIRPAKGADPTLHLADVMITLMLALIDQQVFEVSADAETGELILANPAQLALPAPAAPSADPHETGGSLVHTGDERLRQDELCNRPDEPDLSALSDGARLCAGD